MTVSLLIIIVTPISKIPMTVYKRLKTFAPVLCGTMSPNPMVSIDTTVKYSPLMKERCCKSELTSAPNAI